MKVWVKGNLKVILVGLVLVGLGIIMGRWSSGESVGDESRYVDKSAVKMRDEGREKIKRVGVSEDIESDELFLVTKVVDGDTIKVEMGDYFETVRLIGIDAPETSGSDAESCYGSEATSYLKSLLKNQMVELERDSSQGDKDRYDRYLRYVYLSDGKDVGELMVKQGYAYEYTYNKAYRNQEIYKEAEKFAELERLGLWDKCNNILGSSIEEEGDKSTSGSRSGDTAPGDNETLGISSGDSAPVDDETLGSKSGDSIQEIEDSESEVKSINYEPPPTVTPKPTKDYSDIVSGDYECNCSKACSKMASCEEAYFQLNNCGCTARDGDEDGVPCEKLCSEG